MPHRVAPFELSRQKPLMSASKPREKAAAPGKSPGGAAPPGDSCGGAGPDSTTRVRATHRRTAVKMRIRGGREIADLEAWVQRYVAIVMEADAARRAEGASDGAAPTSALPRSDC